MTINWINEKNHHRRGAFITLGCHREAGGTVRLCMYISAYASEILQLKRGERLLIGLDETGHTLYFRPTLFGGNVLKGRDADESLQVMATLPLQNVPHTQAVRQQDLIIGQDHVAAPFRFNPLPLVPWQHYLASRVAA